MESKNTTKDIIGKPDSHIMIESHSDYIKFTKYSKEVLVYIMYLTCQENLIKKYSIPNFIYDYMRINNIFYNKSCRLTILFNEIFIDNPNIKTLKRFYTGNLSSEKLPKLIDYYKNYSKFFLIPTLRDFKANKIIQKASDMKADVFYLNNKPNIKPADHRYNYNNENDDLNCFDKILETKVIEYINNNSIVSNINTKRQADNNASLFNSRISYGEIITQRRSRPLTRLGGSLTRLKDFLNSPNNMLLCANNNNNSIFENSYNNNNYVHIKNTNEQDAELNTNYLKELNNDSLIISNKAVSNIDTIDRKPFLHNNLNDHSEDEISEINYNLDKYFSKCNSVTNLFSPFINERSESDNIVKDIKEEINTINSIITGGINIKPDSKSNINSQYKRQNSQNTYSTAKMINKNSNNFIINNYNFNINTNANESSNKKKENNMTSSNKKESVNVINNNNITKQAISQNSANIVSNDNKSGLFLALDKQSNINKSTNNNNNINNKILTTLKSIEDLLINSVQKKQTVYDDLTNKKNEKQVKDHLSKFINRKASSSNIITNTETNKSKNDTNTSSPTKKIFKFNNKDSSLNIKEDYKNNIFNKSNKNKVNKSDNVRSNLSLNFLSNKITNSKDKAKIINKNYLISKAKPINTINKAIYLYNEKKSKSKSKSKSKTKNSEKIEISSKSNKMEDNFNKIYNQSLSNHNFMLSKANYKDIKQQNSLERKSPEIGRIPKNYKYISKSSNNILLSSENKHINSTNKKNLENASLDHKDGSRIDIKEFSTSKVSKANYKQVLSYLLSSIDENYIIKNTNNSNINTSNQNQRVESIYSKSPPSRFKGNNCIIYNSSQTEKNKSKFENSNKLIVNEESNLQFKKQLALEYRKHNNNSVCINQKSKNYSKSRNNRCVSSIYNEPSKNINRPHTRIDNNFSTYNKNNILSRNDRLICSSITDLTSFNNNINVSLISKIKNIKKSTNNNRLNSKFNKNIKDPLENSHFNINNSSNLSKNPQYISMNNIVTSNSNKQVQINIYKTQKRDQKSNSIYFNPLKTLINPPSAIISKTRNNEANNLVYNNTAVSIKDKNNYCNNQAQTIITNPVIMKSNKNNINNIDNSKHTMNNKQKNVNDSRNKVFYSNKQNLFKEFRYQINNSVMNSLQKQQDKSKNVHAKALTKDKIPIKSKVKSITKNSNNQSNSYNNSNTNNTNSTNNKISSNYSGNMDNSNNFNVTSNKHFGDNLVENSVLSRGNSNANSNNSKVLVKSLTLNMEEEGMIKPTNLIKNTNSNKHINCRNSSNRGNNQLAQNIKNDDSIKKEVLSNYMKMMNQKTNKTTKNNNKNILKSQFSFNNTNFNNNTYINTLSDVNDYNTLSNKEKISTIQTISNDAHPDNYYCYSNNYNNKLDEGLYHTINTENNNNQNNQIDNKLFITISPFKKVNVNHKFGLNNKITSNFVNFAKVKKSRGDFSHKISSNTNKTMKFQNNSKVKEVNLINTSKSVNKPNELSYSNLNSNTKSSRNKNIQSNKDNNFMSMNNASCKGKFINNMTNYNKKVDLNLCYTDYKRAEKINSNLYASTQLLDLANFNTFYMEK